MYIKLLKKYQTPRGIWYEFYYYLLRDGWVEMGADFHGLKAVALRPFDRASVAGNEVGLHEPTPGKVAIL